MRDVVMKNNLLKVDFNAPLNEKDTELQTYGCRANNPDICSSNGIEGLCAFASNDNICKKPSRAWKKKFYQLSENK